MEPRADLMDARRTMTRSLLADNCAAGASRSKQLEKLPIVRIRGFSLLLSPIWQLHAEFYWRSGLIGEEISRQEAVKRFVIQMCYQEQQLFPDNRISLARAREWLCFWVNQNEIENYYEIQKRK